MKGSIPLPTLPVPLLSREPVSCFSMSLEIPTGNEIKASLNALSWLGESTGIGESVGKSWGAAERLPFVLEMG
jgi:hypothetical protein